MEVRVLYFGIPIGTSDLPVLAGLAHGVLVPIPRGYEIARERVEKAGRMFASSGTAVQRYWPSSRGDFSHAFAAEVGDGYELEDLRGLRVGAASVVVFALAGRESAPLVVADFRPQGAYVLAELPNAGDSSGGRQRPAA